MSVIQLAGRGILRARIRPRVQSPNRPANAACGIHWTSPEFFPLPAPDDHEIARVAAATARGIIRLLERRGLLSDHGATAEDPLQDEHPLLAARDRPCSYPPLGSSTADRPRLE